MGDVARFRLSGCCCKRINSASRIRAPAGRWNSPRRCRPSSNRMSDLRQIVDETIAALEEMKRNGVTNVEVSRETLEALGKPGAGPLTSTGVPPAPHDVAR